MDGASARPTWLARAPATAMLVLLILLCALCTLGLPASQASGSAFNPANENVTIRPQATPTADRIARASPRPPDPVQADPAVEVRIALPTAPATIGQRSAPLSVAAPRLLAQPRAFSPRAPPIP